MTKVLKSLIIMMVTVAGPALATGARFPDPVLTPDEVETAILKGFPSIEAAAAAVDAAVARLTAARRLPDPTVELSGGRGEDRYGPESGSQWGAGLQLELPAPWRYRRATAAARAEISVAEADLLSARARTIARIRTLMVELQAARRRAKVLQTQADMVRRLAAFTTLRVKLGEARELARLRMQVELGRIERRADLARATHDGIVQTLSRLAAGRLPARFHVTLQLNRVLPPLDRSALAKAAVEANPGLAAGRRRAAAALAQTALQRALAVPSFVTRVGTDTEYDSRSTFIVVAVNVPLWNRNRPAVAAAQAEHRIALARVEQVRRTLLARLDAAVSRYGAARRTALRFATEVLPAAREATRLAELSYREGETSILDLLDARRSAQDAELEDVQARLELHLLRVEIDLLTGRLQSRTRGLKESRLHPKETNS